MREPSVALTDCSRVAARRLHAVAAAEPVVDADLALRLADTLRSLRGHLPSHIWWDSGAADVLIEYQARSTVSPPGGHRASAAAGGSGPEHGGVPAR